ncbi:synaptonemal complex central element protein 1-like [Trichechus manatus latirostris]|uniref:Synaptonemal complex central element protein 1-like n=1 Tax=Trichechus manatus latirostris TaxID=127582 RepID=A0A2Y9FX81_TRIMA|nr:synaptonemal complex central element protein 1-like [Trichechus manatus latirostris]
MTGSAARQDKSSEESEYLLAMVKKLQKEGSLEPQIEDLINRINELQQETLRILQLHCQEKESEVQKLDVEEQLKELMGQHKDLWEFHMLEQRLVREISALENSKAQLLTEEMLVRAKLEDVGRQLCSASEVVGSPPVSDGPLLSHPEATAVGLKAELEKLEGQIPAQAQSGPEEEAGKSDAGSHLLGATREKKDLEPRGELAFTPP